MKLSLSSLPRIVFVIADLDTEEFVYSKKVEGDGPCAFLVSEAVSVFYLPPCVCMYSMYLPQWVVPSQNGHPDVDVDGMR